MACDVGKMDVTMKGEAEMPIVGEKLWMRFMVVNERRSLSRTLRRFRQVPRERIVEVLKPVAAADLRAAAVNNHRANSKRRQQSRQLSLRQWQTVRPRTVLPLR